MQNMTVNESGYIIAKDEIMEEENKIIENVDEESLHSVEDQEDAMSSKFDDDILLFNQFVK